MRVLLIRQLQKYQAPFRSCKKALIPILDFISIGYAVTVNLFVSKIKLTTPIKSYIDPRIGTGLTTIAIIRILKASYNYFKLILINRVETLLYLALVKVASKFPDFYAFTTKGIISINLYGDTVIL